MAIAHPFDKILERVTRITADTKFNRWSRPELIDYINEGQTEYCEKTRTLRAESPLYSRENSLIYALPKDCFEVDRIERSDGHVLVKTTSRDLTRAYGTDFQKDTGNPTHYYMDLDGQRHLRFYPHVEPDILAQFSHFDQDLGPVIGADEVELNPLILNGNVMSYDTGDPLYLQSATPQEFDSELGVTTDDKSLDDNDKDLQYFNHDEGLVTSVLVTDDCFRVYYVRYPRDDIQEITDFQALQYYALHKCYEKDGPVQNLETSLLYERRFQERVNREIGRVSSGQHANMSTRGTYA